MTAGTWTPVVTPGLGQVVCPKGIDEHNQIIGWSGRPIPKPAGTAETICFWTSPYATLSAVAGDHQWDYRQEPDLKWGAGYPLHSQDQGTIENEDDSSQPLEPAPLRARWDANNDTSFDIQTGIKNNGPAPLPGTRHICRLMCSGPNSDGSSRLLVKGKWDEAEKWLKERERQRELEN